jgi:HlyD family secretion protein
MPSELATLVKTGATHPLRKWLVIAFIAAVLAGLWLVLKNGGSGDDAGPDYVTAPLRRGDLSVTITATGNLEPTNQVTVGSELSGIVLEVFVEANDRVTKGQKLARLDTSKLSQQTERSRAALASARAKVVQTEATVREAKAGLARLEELHRISGGKTPSKADLETATATADRAEADRLSALAAVAENEATVRANESDLAKAVITSPVDGIVLSRTIEPGQTVAAQFTAPELFIIAEKLETMELQVAVAEADIGKVANGQPASFTVDAWPDRTYSATVRKVSYGSTITDNVITYATELAVPNEDLSLRPGMTATADIETGGRKNVWLAPAVALRFKPQDPEKSAAPAPKKTFLQSLMPGPPRRGSGTRPPPAEQEELKRPGKSQVYLLKDGRPVAVPVKTGLTDGRQTEISGDGLAGGALVIIRQITAPAP